MSSSLQLIEEFDRSVKYFDKNNNELVYPIIYKLYQDTTGLYHLTEVGKGKFTVKYSNNPKCKKTFRGMMEYTILKDCPYKIDLDILNEYLDDKGAHYLNRYNVEDFV